MRKTIISALLLLVSFSAFADATNDYAGLELSHRLPTGTKIGKCLVVKSEFNELNEYVLAIEQTKDLNKKGIFKYFKKLDDMEIVSTVMVELRVPTYYSSNTNNDVNITYASFSNPGDGHLANKSLTIQSENSKKGQKITQFTIKTDTGITINCI